MPQTIPSSFKRPFCETRSVKSLYEKKGLMVIILQLEKKY